MPAFRRDVRPSVRTIGVLLTVAIGGLFPSSAAAQNAARAGKWAIELYGGGSSTSASSSGTPLAGFTPGTPFTLQSGQPSRAVSSWFFGDGAALFNQVLTQFAANAGTTFPRIASLDTALLQNGGSQGSGAVIGLRLGRALTPKLAIEFNVERSLAKLGVSASLLNGMEAASESFIDAFEALLKTAPVTNVSVTSTVMTPNASNAQIRLGGALKWTVFTGNRIQAYVSGGGGVIRNSGDNPQAILNGRYSFRLFGAFPMDETDRVVVTVNQQKNSAMGMVGGGLTYDFSSSSGLRADVRLLLNSTKDVTTMTAAPSVAALNPTQVLPTATNISPGLQFSTQSGVRSTLSGPNANFTLFTGSGLSKQISFTLGIFKRF
ncbi:MAG: hypothetical protein ABIP90_06490 [Vicinamibacterales bacterium]